jgi:hypothetical protein
MPVPFKAAPNLIVCGALACSGADTLPPSPTAAGTVGMSGTSSSIISGASSTSGGAPAAGGALAATGGTMISGFPAGRGGAWGEGSSSGMAMLGGANFGGAPATDGAANGLVGGVPGAGGSAGSAGSVNSIGGQGGTGGARAVSFAEVSLFIRAQCGTCHTGRTPPNLDTTREPSALYTTLTSVSVARCGGNKLVTPNDPSRSALLMVGMGQCGTLRMPAGCTDSICYSVADESLLTNWILAGAKSP